MAEAMHAFVIWAGTGEKSVIKSSTIVSGMATPKQEVTARWRGRNYAAIVVQVGKLFSTAICLGVFSGFL